MGHFTVRGTEESNLPQVPQPRLVLNTENGTILHEDLIPLVELVEESGGEVLVLETTTFEGGGVLGDEFECNLAFYGRFTFSELSGRLL